MSGEIRSEAAVQGRRITLDPIMENSTLEVQPVRVENLLPAGFRQEFLTGGNEEWEFDLCTGVGNSYLMMSVRSKTDPKDVRDEIIDLRPMVQAWVSQVIGSGPSPVWSNEKQAFVPYEGASDDAVG